LHRLGLRARHAVPLRFRKGNWFFAPSNNNIGDGGMRDFLKVMKACSDPDRVKILKMLPHQMMCVGETQAALKLAQPTVSSHLQMLEEAGLVRSPKEHGLPGGAGLVGGGAGRPLSRA